jgi:hypothetical protein
LEPFTFHWNTGVVPPFVGVAVNVTGIPGATGFAETEIEMLAVSGLTIIMMAFEVAGDPELQTSLEVRVQVIKSLLTDV